MTGPVARRPKAAPSGAASAVWTLTPFEVLTRRWDHEVALYHAGSGDTLLLSEFGATVLEELRHGPGTVEELLGRLRDRFGVEDDADTRLAVKGMLSRLLNHGIIAQLR